MLYTFISALLVFIVIFIIKIVGNKIKDVATEEVEYMIVPSNTMVNLKYRFKGERRWKYIQQYYCGAYDGWYGHFSPIDFDFREDGNYEYLKREYTKQRIINHNERILSRYHSIIKERDGWGKREKEIRSKNKVSKRI
jgi:hypothetical protein